MRIITQIAEALHFAHGRRVIHRDVKPDNILLAPDGRAKLTDLGLAKDFDSETHLTRPSTGLGTPNFMAPEQFSDAKHADAQCDVYSLGATLYMATYGRAAVPCPRRHGRLEEETQQQPRPAAPAGPGHESLDRDRHLPGDGREPAVRPASCLEFLEQLNGDGPRAGDDGPPGVGRRRIDGFGRASARGRDRRATTRFESAKECPCQALSSEKDVRWSAEVKDVSADGIGLLMNRRFEPRTVLTLEIPAKDQTAAHRLLIRVVRVQPMTKRRWLVGCIFAMRLGDEEVRTMI